MAQELYDVTAEAALVANQGYPAGRDYKHAAGYPLYDATGKVIALAQISFPANGSTAKGTAGGPAPDQAQRIWSSIFMNPNGADIQLETVGGGPVATGAYVSPTQPGGPSATLSTAINASGVQTVTLSNVNNIAVGQPLYIDTVASGKQEKVTVLAVSGNTITATFANTHAVGALVFGTTSFLLTDFVVTGYGASLTNAGVLLKYTTPLIGAITAGAARTFQLTHLPTNPAYGGGLFPGCSFVINEGGGSAETVVVTSYSSATGIGTATFANSHSAGELIGVTLDAANINSTKGIEEVGIESQPVAPPGTGLVLNIAAFTGTAYVNVRGVTQS